MGGFQGITAVGQTYPGHVSAHRLLTTTSHNAHFHTNTSTQWWGWVHTLTEENIVYLAFSFHTHIHGKILSWPQKFYKSALRFDIIEKLTAHHQVFREYLFYEERMKGNYEKMLKGFVRVEIFEDGENGRDLDLIRFMNERNVRCKTRNMKSREWDVQTQQSQNHLEPFDLVFVPRSRQERIVWASGLILSSLMFSERWRLRALAWKGFG